MDYSSAVVTNESNGAQTVIVTGQRSTLDILPQKILDTPQSINVVTAKLLEQQGGGSLADALKNVPGVTLNAGEGGTHGDLVNLRGFSAGDDYFMDGLRDTGLYDRDAFDYEAVEVYKGPASTLFGRGSTGGVINQVLKTPQLTSLTRFSAIGGNNSQTRATADVNIPFATSSAARLNLMGQRSLVEGRPFARTQRWGVAPAVAFGIDTPTTLTLKYLHQHEDNIPDYGVPFLFDRPAPVSRDTFYGLPSDDRFGTKVDVVTGRLQHSFSDTWTISDTARYGHYYFLSRETAAIYGTGTCFTSTAMTGYFSGAPLCASGNPAGQVPVTANNPYFPVVGTPVSAVYVLRDRPSGSGTIETAMNDLNVTGRFATGSVDHTLVFGVEYDNESADLTRFVNQDTVITAVSILAPNPFESFPGTQGTVNQTPQTSTDTQGAYITDTVNFGRQWQLTAALRYDDFHASFTQPVGRATHFDHTDGIWSPRAALVYKPTDASSVYFSYGTSFNPSAENLALSASNSALPPEKDRTYEIGAKMQALDNLLSITGAVFDTEMTNARITDPLQPTLQALSGTEKVKGAEIGAQGYITQHWEVLGGYTYLDPSAVGLAGAGIQGPIPNTAHNQANVWTTYEFVGGLKLGSGVNYISERFAGTDTQAFPGVVSVPTVPGYVTFDAMAGYEVSRSLDFQLNVYNLTDKYYYMNSYFTRPNENHTVPGAGRTFLLSARFSP
ncbi:MAG TPA: TonB-dependent receptor [Steroidobacteraceae bacterium]